jgi:hypothetical protein
MCQQQKHVDASNCKFFHILHLSFSFSFPSALKFYAWLPAHRHRHIPVVVFPELITHSVHYFRNVHMCLCRWIIYKLRSWQCEKSQHDSLLIFISL